VWGLQSVQDVCRGAEASTPGPPRAVVSVQAETSHGMQMRPRPTRCSRRERTGGGTQVVRGGRGGSVVKCLLPLCAAFFTPDGLQRCRKEVW